MENDGIEFEWDEANLNHVQHHGIAPVEAEQDILNDPLDIEAHIVDGEERSVSVGRTDRDRFLVVVTTMRGERIRVVTAFDAVKRLADLYLTEKGS